MRERIKDILDAEAAAITAYEVDETTEHAVRLILDCTGKLFTTGIGKAGYVARKASSTFSTTGTPSVFIHPGDASHGDIGVVSKNDILLAYSNSGKTREVIETTRFCQHLGIRSVISICSDAKSPLAELSDVVIELGTIKEPCPLGLTPTASTTVMIAISDALALIVMEESKFSAADFADRHHGGYLGEKTRPQRRL